MTNCPDRKNNSPNEIAAHDATASRQRTDSDDPLLARHARAETTTHPSDSETEQERHSRGADQYAA